MADDLRNGANRDTEYNIDEKFYDTFAVTDQDDAAVDLSAVTLVYSIRETENGTPIDTLSTASEITVNGASNNQVTMEKSSIDGIAERTYYHDLKDTTNNKKIFDGKLIAGYGAYGV